MLLRTFTWPDLPAYARLVGEARDDSSYTARAAEEYLRQPNLRPERDLFLAEVDGRLAGAVLVVPEPAIGRTIIEGEVSQPFQSRGVSRVLLERAVEHSRELGVRVVHVAATPERVDLRRLLGALGFQEASRQWRMRLDLRDQRRGRPVSGYELRQMRPGEEAVVTDLQNRAFTGSFGFAPNVPEEIAYRTRMGHSRPEDVLLLYAEGRPVAYCWTRRPLPGGPAVGVVWMIGADPEARGKGYGRAMLLESIDYLARNGATAVELTVYQHNTPAVALYHATGFRETGEIIWYEKELGARG